MDILIDVLKNPSLWLAIVIAIILRGIFEMAIVVKSIINTYDDNFAKLKKASDEDRILLASLLNHAIRLNILENLQEPPKEWNVNQERVDKIVNKTGIHQQAAYRKLIMNFGQKIDEEK